MSLDELRALPEFTIENDHGRIKFKPPAGSSGIDITQVDLERCVLIKSRKVEVYENMVDKPAFGNKLNVPAIITLFCVPPTKNATP